jgi:LmbE family N-acetylglucosaminyl deacetylase
MSNKLWLSPHSDDSVLFGAFTLMREHPLVVTVTSAYIQSNRGENITAQERMEEDRKACELLGCSHIDLAIRDDVIDDWAVRRALGRFSGFETIYAPAVQGGNKDHDLIGRIADEVFGDKVKHYTTYTPTELYTTGSERITGNERELELKEKALQCFQSQINLPATKPHFEAIKGRSEWFM